MGSSSRGCEQEVSAVENVKCLRIKFQVHPFGELESLRQCHIGVPLAWANKSIASEVADAAQASRELLEHWQVCLIGNTVVRCPPTPYHAWLVAVGTG